MFKKLRLFILSRDMADTNPPPTHTNKKIKLLEMKSTLFEIKKTYWMGLRADQTLKMKKLVNLKTLKQKVPKMKQSQEKKKRKKKKP